MLDSVVNKFQKNNIKVTVRGLNEASSIMIDKYGTHAKIQKRSFRTFLFTFEEQLYKNIKAYLLKQLA